MVIKDNARGAPIDHMLGDVPVEVGVEKGERQ
jgi:hypothetical protein